jgi:hypothetical protein
MQAPTTKRRQKKGKRMLVFLPELGCLAIYVGYAQGVSILSMLGVVLVSVTSDPRQLDLARV